MQRSTTLAASTRNGEKKCAAGLRPVHRLDQQQSSGSSKRSSLSPKKAFKSEGTSSKIWKEDKDNTSSTDAKVVRVRAPVRSGAHQKKEKELVPPTRWSRRLANASKESRRPSHKIKQEEA
jgi:hypothetical protein